MKELKARDVFFKILFVRWGNRNSKQERWVWSPHKLDMSHVDRPNMGCRHRAGFTYRLSRLKHRASEKMGGLITNNEDLFFLFTDTFSGKQKIWGYVFLFFLFTIPIFSVKTGHLRTWRPFFAFPISVIKQLRAAHCLNPALMSVFRGGSTVPCPSPFDSAF